MSGHGKNKTLEKHEKKIKSNKFSETKKYVSINISETLEANIITEIESSFANFKKKPNTLRYDIIVKNINEAKRSGIDVSKYKEQLPELKKLI